MKHFLQLLISFFLLLSVNAQQKRPVSPIDIYRLQHVSDPHVSPDGKWILYVLSTVDTIKDKRNSDIWMTSWDGKENIQITNSPDGESSPRFSPDGKYISFTASRGSGDDKEEKKTQIYLLNRH
ncbi:MAG: S9 family peptidase, partial [Bacteroidota bacterium]